MNLNKRPSIDPRWTTHHTPVVAGFMLAEISVTRKIAGAEVIYQPATRTYLGTFENVYQGRARIQPFGIIGDMVVGQDTTSRRLMRIQIDNLNTGINVDDMVRVTACPADPELMLFNIEVRGSIGSSNSWVTDLVCEADVKHG